MNDSNDGSAAIGSLDARRERNAGDSAHAQRESPHFLIEGIDGKPALRDLKRAAGVPIVESRATDPA
jgi:hypothetical protein